MNIVKLIKIKIGAFILFNILFTICFVAVVKAQSFVHPGLLHSKEDLERMKEGVANKVEPIYSGYQVFIQNPASQYTYKMQGPMEMVGRNPTVGQGTYDSDANAAHQNAIMWAITGDKRYADKAIEIINAWSSTLKSITGRDAVLMAGLGPYKMVNAAEIIRYTNAGWPDADIMKTEKHFKEVIYPVLKNFAPFANGNWDAAAIKTVMAIAVFCNDRPMFERALRYYVNGKGNGRLTNYIINDTGEIQESGRDQQHTQLGIGLLAESCEIAWHQGLNLYGYDNNRLLKGFEYVAQYNLGYDVPFTETLDRTGKYHHTVISTKGRGNLRAIYEQVYNHFVNRMGISAPYTQKAAEELRPEGPGRPGADHPGYGTLYYSIPPSPGNDFSFTVPTPPAAIIIKGSAKGNMLKWIAPVGATGYIVKRGIKSGGPNSVIAKNVRESNYIDNQVKPGTIYYYTVSAVNAKGESGNAYETAIAAGLPSPWKNKDIGKVGISGSVDFDGSVYRMEGTGMGIDSLHDECQFVYRPFNGNGEITARFVPQPASQFSQMGLMMREALTDDAPYVSLLIDPQKTEQIEAPLWQEKLLSRNRQKSETNMNQTSYSLKPPAFSWGRLTGYVWLRLQRKGNTFTGYTSYDGKEWIKVGTETVPLKKSLLIGIPVASGIKTVSTILQFDNVSVKNVQ
jgi:hypothetical protein